MDINELNFEQLKSLATGKDLVDGFSTPLAQGFYGKVYEHPDDPTKVIKFQYGDQRNFYNEIDWLGESYFTENTDVPRIHQSGFVDDPTSDPNLPKHYGASFIVQDKVDHGRSIGADQEARGMWRRQQALARLYNREIKHSDTHLGNILYDPRTDTPHIVDLGLAGRSYRGHDNLTKAKDIAEGFRYAGDFDSEQIFTGLVNEAYRSGDQRALTGIVDDGLESLEKSKFTPGLQSVVGKNTPATSASVSQPKALPNLKPNTPKLSSWPISGYEIPTRAQAAFLGGLSVGAADLIPSRETIKTGFKEGLVPAIRNHSGEFVRGLPYGVGTGLVTMSAPVIAPVVAGAGLGLTGMAAVDAVDETVKQQTGEGVLSKVRQTLGTEKRSGYASPNNSLKQQIKRDIELINNPPTITPTKPNPLYGSLKNSPVPVMGRRLRLAGERFNPLKGEFGITELLFGR